MRLLQFSFGEDAEGGCASQLHYFLQECPAADDIDIIGRTMGDVNAAFSAIEWEFAKSGLLSDDIDIIGRMMRDVTAALSAIERESAKMGLAVNEGKTKYSKVPGLYKKNKKLVFFCKHFMVRLRNSPCNDLHDQEDYRKTFLGHPSVWH